MGFLYRGTKITMENYTLIFSNYTLDTLDEIRSAVLDDTQIGNYLTGTLLSDSEKLGQFRKALRENVPIMYLSSGLTRKSIKCVRQLYNSENDMSWIPGYINGASLTIDASVFELALEYYSIGVSEIRNMNLSKVKSEKAEILFNSMYSGCPLHLYLPYMDEIDEAKARALVSASKLGLHIQDFIKKFWETDWITMIVESHTRGYDVSSLVAMVSSEFDTERLQIILTALEDNLDYTLLCKQDSGGHLIYNQWQMEVLVMAMNYQVLTDEIMNPLLSDSQMSNIMAETLKNR